MDQNGNMRRSRPWRWGYRNHLIIFKCKVVALSWVLCSWKTHSKASLVRRQSVQKIVRSFKVYWIRCFHWKNYDGGWFLRRLRKTRRGLLWLWRARQIGILEKSPRSGRNKYWNGKSLLWIFHTKTRSESSHNLFMHLEQT